MKTNKIELSKKLLLIFIRIFYILFTILFTAIFISSIFRDGSVFYKLNHIISFIVFMVVLFLWIYLYKLVKYIFSKINKKQKKILYIVTFLLIIGIFVFLFFNLEIPLGWDYNVIYIQAKQRALTGSRLIDSVYPEYLQYFPNNISIYVIETIIFKISLFFKYNNLLNVAVIFNECLIFLSILFTFLFCKKKFGDTKSYFSLLIFLCFVPLFLYSPIFYSDTMSVLFGPLLLYIYTFIDFKDIKSLRSILLIMLIGVIAFLGIKIKMTILFVVFGICCDIFIKYGLKKIINICTILFVIYFSLNFIYVKRFNDYNVNNFGNIPITHWIMMGIEDPNVDNSKRNSYGGYNEEDYIKTKKFKNGDESKKWHIKEIKRRLYSYNFISFLDYIDKKIVNIWGDGSYFSAIKLNIDNKNNSNNLQKILSGEDKNRILLYFEQGVQLCLLFMLAFSGFHYFKSENKSKDNLLIHIPIFMLMLFLILWEGRSRYLYNYIPLFVIIVTNYIEKISIIKKTR